jgi:hypothetical protein
MVCLTRTSPPTVSRIPLPNQFGSLFIEAGVHRIASELTRPAKSARQTAQSAGLSGSLSSFGTAKPQKLMQKIHRLTLN